MEIVSTMTFELKQQEISSAAEQNAEVSPLASPQSSNEKASKESANINSVYHTPDIFTPRKDIKMDLSKVRSALSELNAAVKEDEEHYFVQLESAENKNLRLRQSIVSSEDLKSTNGTLQKANEQLKNTNEALQSSLEEAHKLQSTMRKEAETQELTVSNLQSTNSTLKSSLEEAHKLLSTMRAEAETQVQTLSKNMGTRDAEIARLQTELDTLQREFEVVKADKDEIEQGHEEAKEKWKRLVITMKSEYDNFRASFDNLKASKKEMEEKHRKETEKLEKEVSKMRSENANLSSSLEEHTQLQSEFEKLRASKKESDEQLEELKSSFEVRLKEAKEEAETIGSSIEECIKEANEETEALKCSYEERIKEANEETEALKCSYEKRIKEAREETETVKASLEQRIKEAQEEAEMVKAGLEQRLKEAQEETELARVNAQERVKEVAAETEVKLSAVEQEYISLKSEFSSLQSQLDSLQAEYTQLEDVKAVNEAALRQETERLEAAVATLQASYDQLRSEYEDREAGLIAINTELETMTAAKNDSDKTVATLQSDYDVLASTYDTQKADYDTLKTEYDMLKTKFDNLANEREASVATVATLQSDYDLLASTFDTQKADYERLKTDFDSLIKEKEASEATVATLQSDYDLLTSTFDTQKSDYERLKTDFDSLIKDKEASEATFATLQSEYDALASKTADYDTLKTDCATLKTDIDNINKEKEALEETVVALESSKKELEAIKATHEEAESNHKAERVKWEETIERMQSEYDTLEGNFDSLSSSMVETTKLHHEEVQKYEKKIAKLTKTVETKTEALSLGLTKYLAELKAKEAVEKELAGVQEELAQKIEEEKKYISDLDGAEKRVQTLNDLMAFKLEEAEKLRQTEIEKREAVEEAHRDTEEKYAEMEKVLAKTESEVLSTQCQCDSLRECLEKTQAEKQELVDKFPPMEKELEETKASCQSLQTNLQELQAAKDEVDKESEERKQQIAVLNKSVAKKIATITSLESHLDSLQSSLDLSKESENVTVKKIDFLHQLVSSKEKELDLIKSRCESLQSSLDEAEAQVEKKNELGKQLQAAESKAFEAKLLCEKKDAELRTAAERCEKLQAALKEAEASYQHGVESTRDEIERQQKAALEEAQDRAYVLNQMLAKKEEELESLRTSYVDPAEKAEHTDEHKAMLKKIEFLDQMAAGKDNELQLVKMRCENLQASLDKMQEANRRLSEKNNQTDFAEAEQKLEALKREIATRKSELEALKNAKVVSDRSDQDEFEVILDDGEKVQNLQDELDTVKERCVELEAALKEKSLIVDAAADGSNCVEQLQLRNQELEATLQITKKMLKEESERRKEAEQVFLAIGQPQPVEQNESMADQKPPRKAHVFSSRRPAPEQADALPKKSRWLSLRGRRKKEEYEQRDDSVSRTHSPSKWRSQQYSPRRRMMASENFSTASFARGAEKSITDGGAKSTADLQIPTHIRSHFGEVGFFKQRLQSIYLPVLVLGPFDVPPGPIRDDWLSQYTKSGRVLNLGVYFYGKADDDQEKYGTIPWFSFVPYAKAVQRNLHEIPKEILGKIEAGEELTSIEKQIKDGNHQISEAANKKPEERAHPLKHLAKEIDCTTPKVPDCIVTDSSSADADCVSEMGI
jgi:chromosome segregation ATPase